MKTNMPCLQFSENQESAHFNCIIPRNTESPIGECSDSEQCQSFNAIVSNASMID